MRRLLLAAAFALSTAPAFAAAPEAAPPPDRGSEARQHAGHAARETGSALRRGWEGTKHVARETGSALEKGWHTIEHGFRWGWNHPNHPQRPADTD